MQDAQTKSQKEMAARMAEYRAKIRASFGRMSDQALAFQSRVIRGGIDREEVDREINRRRGG